MRLVGRPGWIASYAGLPRTLYALFAANVALSLGNLVWPMFTPLLQQGLGVAPGWAGVLLTLTMVATAGGALVGGQLADRFGRAGVLVATRALAALAVGLCAPLTPLPAGAQAIPGLLILASFFRGASEPTLQALAADLTTPGQRPAAFSLLYLSNKVGFLAPLIGGVLFRSHLNWLFLGTALAAASSVALTGAALLGRSLAAPSPAAEADPPAARHVGGLLPVLRQRPRLIAVTMLLAGLSFVHVQHLYGLPLQLGRWYGAAGAGLYGSLLSFNALIGVLLTAPLTALTAHGRPATNLALGGLLYAVGFGVLSGRLAPPWLFASTLVWSLGELLIYTHGPAYLQDQTPPSHRGRLGAAAGLLSQTGYALGPGLTGLLLTHRGLPSVWMANAAISFAAAAGLALSGMSAPGLGGRRKA